ncbi:MAG: glycosyltransferase family 4 protein [candidate division Zixibacteria bacterium]|nr:glycosyltransferase family 4 protein [candidate division Zixibacteria bacterium]
MRILALNWNDLKNPYGGGAEVHLEELLRRLVKYGHQVTLFCSGFKDCAAEEVVEGIRIIRRGNRYNFNLIAPFHLRKMVKENNFDILIEDINKIPFYTPLYLNLNTLVVVPHLFATTVFHEINFVLGSYIYLSERPFTWVYKRSKFNVISESTADDLAKRGIPRKNISVTYCGIDREIYKYDSSVSKYEQPTILYLGRIKKYKSIQHLILAFRKVKDKISDARLMIVGAGDYLKALKKLADSLKLSDAVDFAGFVSQDEKVERMRRSHLAVLPSIREGWGLTNIECNSVGTTVVAANSPGLRDSVKDGETGLLYPYGDVGALVESIMKILSNIDYRQQLEKSALEWAESFNWDSAAREFEEQLIELDRGTIDK